MPSLAPYSAAPSVTLKKVIVKIALKVAFLASVSLKARRVVFLDVVVGGIDVVVERFELGLLRR